MDYNFTDSLNNIIYNKDCSISWNNAIMDFCNSWKNYSTNAHNFYIIVVGLLLITNLVKTLIFKKDIRLYKMFNEQYNIYLDIYIFAWLSDIFIGLLVVRIIQVWYIVNYVLV
jgi:hypothetical protein